MKQARDELVGLRETVVWAALYPSELLRTFAPSHVLVGGRRAEVERHLNIPNQLPVHGVVDVLRADAEHFSTVSTVEQAAAMQGVSRAELKGDEAMWAGSDADLAAPKREKEQLRALYESTWGRPPSEVQ